VDVEKRAVVGDAPQCTRLCQRGFTPSTVPGARCVATPRNLLRERFSAGTLTLQLIGRALQLAEQRQMHKERGFLPPDGRIRAVGTTVVLVIGPGAGGRALALQTRAEEGES